MDLKNDFAVHCEMDCDHMTLHTMGEETTGIEYAATMLHLMELSSYQQGHKAGSLGALGFLLAKQRLGFILNEPITIMRRIICITVLAIFPHLDRHVLDIRKPIALLPISILRFRTRVFR